MNAQISKEALDVSGINIHLSTLDSEISAIQSKDIAQDLSLNSLLAQIQANTYNFSGIKNWDGTFITEFEDVYSKLNVIKTDLSDNKILDI